MSFDGVFLGFGMLKGWATSNRVKIWVTRRLGARMECRSRPDEKPRGVAAAAGSICQAAAVWVLTLRCKRSSETEHTFPQRLNRETRVIRPAVSNCFCESEYMGDFESCGHSTGLVPVADPVRPAGRTRIILGGHPPGGRQLVAFANSPPTGVAGLSILLIFCVLYLKKSVASTEMYYA